MLVSYSRYELESNSIHGNDEIDHGSDRTRQDVAQNSEDFRSLQNSNSREKSESTGETMRLVNSEVSKQMDELRKDLNSQIIDTINSVIGEKVFPDIRNIMTSQNPLFWDEVDHRYGRLNKTTEEEYTGSACKSDSRRDYFRANTDVPLSSDEDHVTMMTNSHDRRKKSFFSTKNINKFATTSSHHCRCSVNEDGAHDMGNCPDRRPKI